MGHPDTLFNINNFIDNFVYKNWCELNYTYILEDIDTEILSENELLEEEIFYKYIIYNEY